LVKVEKIGVGRVDLRFTTAYKLGIMSLVDVFIRVRQAVK